MTNLAVSSSASAAANAAAVAASTTATKAASAGAGSASSLTQANFLQLLTAQLKYQTPTTPANPTQMAQEFAAISKMCIRDRTSHLPHGARIRIWSLPCSTGEEPYSIALYLLENWPEIEDYEVELLASDIDTAALAAARTGIYTARALHRLPRDVVQRYFSKLDADRFRLSNTIRQAVNFSQVNASDPHAMQPFAEIDVIFCRNMLIYFDDRSRQGTVDAFYESLCEGGFVCVGHSESMSRISSLFRVRRFPQGVVYQKPGDYR